MPLVSVIIPYQKKRNYIKKTLYSVLNQKFNRLEIIIIYDDKNLTDYFYLKKIIKKYKKVKIIINKKNSGVGNARNLGVKNAKGKYLAFIDADDIWEKNKLSKQISFMELNNYEITHTSYNIINKDGKKIGHRTARDFLNINSLLKSCDIGLSTVIIKKKILGNKFKFPKIKTKEDFVLWLRLLKNNYKIMSLNQNLVKWRKMNKSLSSSILQKLLDGFKVYNFYMGYSYIVSFYLLLCLSINFLRKND